MNRQKTLELKHDLRNLVGKDKLAILKGVDESRLRTYFEKNFEFQSRHKRGLIRDTMYMGCLRDSLLHSGFSKKLLKELTDKQWIEARYVFASDISEKQGGYRLGYVYKGLRIDRNKIVAGFKSLLKLFKK